MDINFAVYLLRADTRPAPTVFAMDCSLFFVCGSPWGATPTAFAVKLLFIFLRADIESAPTVFAMDCSLFFVCGSPWGATPTAFAVKLLFIVFLWVDMESVPTAFAICCYLFLFVGRPRVRPLQYLQLNYCLIFLRADIESAPTNVCNGLLFIILLHFHYNW